MKKQFLTAIIFLSLIPHLWGQDGWTIYDDTNSELGSGSFTSIAIDQDGDIWAGGLFSGLAVYDGTLWTRYTSSNSDLVSNLVNDLVVNSNNDIWAGTLYGISAFDGTNFTTYDSSNTVMNGRQVYTLGIDNDDDIWIASKNSTSYEGITVYDGSTWTNLTGYPSQIDGDEFVDFAFTSNNDAWLAGSGITKYNEAFTFYPYAATGLWFSDCVTVDEDDNVWAGGFDGLLKYDGTSWDFTENNSSGLPNNTYYNTIYADGDYLWIGTSQGFLKYNITSGLVEANYNSENSPLEDNSVYDIEKDADGFFWLATTIGVVKMDENAVGINELYANTIFDVYPNPSNGEIRIISDHNSESADLLIYSMDGRIVYSANYYFGEVLNLDLNSGNYILKINTNEGFSTSILSIVE